MALKVLSTPSFDRVVKKMHTRDKKAVDQAVVNIAADPTIGEEKKAISRSVRPKIQSQ